MIEPGQVWRFPIYEGDLMATMRIDRIESGVVYGRDLPHGSPCVVGLARLERAGTDVTAAPVRRTQARPVL